MCFTININTNRDAIEKRFNVDASALKDFEYRYFYKAFENPLIPVITQQEPEQVQLMNWGLIPHWVENMEQAAQIRKGTYNARAESLKEKAFFQNALANGRCRIVARGFFEWQHIRGERIPWYVSLKNHPLFTFAGLYDTWIHPETGEHEKTFSIITTKANALMEKIHNTKKRMPVILDASNEQKWIEKSLNENDINRLLIPFNENFLNAYTIGKDISRQSANPSDKSILNKVVYPVNGTLF